MMAIDKEEFLPGLLIQKRFQPDCGLLLAVLLDTHHYDILIALLVSKTVTFSRR